MRHLTRGAVVAVAALASRRGNEPVATSDGEAQGFDLKLLQQRISNVAVGEMIETANNWRTGRCTQRTVAVHDDWVRRLACARGRVACGTYSGQVLVTDMDSGELLRHWKPAVADADRGADEAAEVTAIGYDGEHLASGDAVGSLYLRAGNEAVLHARHGGIVTGVHWDGGGAAYSASADRRFVRWSVATGEVEAELQLPRPILSMSVCENYVALGLDDGSVSVLTLQPIQQLFNFDAHERSAVSSVKLVTVSQLLTGCASGEVALWRLDEDDGSGRRVTRFSGHEGPVIGLDGDAEKIASAARDGTVRVWDSEAGNLRFMLQGYTPYISSVNIASSWLMADGTNNALVVMDFRTDSLGEEVPESESD